MSYVVVDDRDWYLNQSRGWRRTYVEDLAKAQVFTSVGRAKQAYTLVMKHRKSANKYRNINHATPDLKILKVQIKIMGEVDVK